MSTESNKTQHQLSVAQENAIDLLVTGKRDREVAEAVNVNRSTVTQWRNHDAEFIAALNGRRREIWGSQSERLRNLVAKAVDVLEADLSSEDQKWRQSAAIHILKAVKLYGSDLQPDGQTDPKAILLEWDEAKFMRDLQIGFALARQLFLHASLLSGMNPDDETDPDETAPDDGIEPDDDI